MVDFASIRAHRGSQHSAFEELVVQLVRRRPPSGAKEFRRIEGSGGDAGVEALWILNDGSETGFQAKFFLRVRDIDWAQIDASVKTTLSKRPNVTTYYIAIACDLTDKGGTKGRGRTGWSAWEIHLRRWQKRATELNRTIQFVPVTASELIDWIAQPSAAGLARYWFGADVLSLNWFSERIHIASADLGERYTPEQHVVVTASLVFDGLARSLALRTRLREAISATKKHGVRARREQLPESVLAGSAKAADALDRVYAIDTELAADATTRWNLEQWLTDVRLAQDALDTLDQCLRESEPQQLTKESGSSGNTVREDWSYFRYRVREAEHSVRGLNGVLSSTALQCDASRVLILTGEAGTGKSHLLAAEAHRSLAEGRPALLFLGQQFSQGNPWDQCVRSLGLPMWPRDEMLGALDAAGEAHGARLLILVDAVNEGAGANLWKNYLSGFIEELASYKNIALVVACRSEYVPYAIPKLVFDSYPRVELRGFTTFEEQEAAAIQYLDRRGIVRPAGPLLAPEFSHPLFLKATSNALLMNGETVFPRGLRGALKILGFYLDSVGRNLLPIDAEPVDLSDELRRALSALAAYMAEFQLDYVPIQESRQVVTNAFAPRIPPSGLTWLDVLLRNGIIRQDPDPSRQNDDEFAAHDDVIRVAFQRFQDHLIAKSILIGVTTSDQLFRAGGKLEWLGAGERHYERSGLLEALSIQIPESLGQELVDILPGGAERWWEEWGVQEGFTQSVRWRAIQTSSGSSTFTDRSLALLNALRNFDDLGPRLLLEVAAVNDHPWNAELLHRNLWKWDLPKRDRLWSRALAFATDDEDHPIHRIITWSTGGRLDMADGETLRLVALVLTWTCATVSRPIRDKATRGLSRILCAAPQLHHDLLKTFVSVNDPYVLERFLSASYGAASRLRADQRLELIASSTFKFIFSDGRPPCHLLSRDYALGTLEIAQSCGKLSPDIEIAKAKPPYLESGKLRAPSKATLDRMRDKVGDRSIYWSCDTHGDFGCYEIAPSVSKFTATRLKEPPPLTRENKLTLFEAQVVKIDAQRAEAFATLRKAVRSIWNLDISGSELSITITRRRIEGALFKAEQAEAAFLELLSAGERTRYIDEVQSHLFGIDGRRRHKEPPTFKPGWAQRWVTNRAYLLGWTKDQFGEDRVPGYSSGRERSTVERVGKKYQWIAIFELLARLSDGYWLKGEWGALPRPYAYPTDISYHRDVDVTLPADADVEQPADCDWWRVDFKFRSIENNELAAWVAADDSWQEARESIFREDDARQKWVTLNSYQGRTENHADHHEVAREFDMRRQAFLFVQSLVVQKSNLAASFAAFKSSKPSDGWRLGPDEIYDGPFWGELGWRGTWPNLGWRSDFDLPKGVLGLKPIAEYIWESHLDRSRPNGVRLLFPVPELIAGLHLRYPDSRHPRIGKNTDGEPIFVHHEAAYDGSHASVVRRDAFAQFLIDQDLGCLWFVFGERNAWPDGRARSAPRRWFGRIVSFDGVKTRTFEWERS